MCKAIEIYGEEQKRQGEMKSKIETALKMLKANFEVNQIADLTGLSISKVEELRDGVPA